MHKKLESVGLAETKDLSYFTIDLTRVISLCTLIKGGGELHVFPQGFV